MRGTAVATIGDMDLDRRWRAAPDFTCTLMPDGRTYLAQDVEPYRQFWISDHERRLWAGFARRGGCAVREALVCAGLDPVRLSQPSLRAWLGRIEALAEVGVLRDPQAEAAGGASRYTRAVAETYRRHRPFPAWLAQHIAREAGLGPGRRALDLAGGPGDLALQLAASGADVTLLDWSAGFLDAARAEARERGLPLRTVRDSANRLAQHDGGPYDLITTCQALHWLDDVQVLRGVLRLLQPQGWWFVVHAAIEVPRAHPLAHLLGAQSLLGAKAPVAFADEARALHERLCRLIDGLQSPGVDRMAAPDAEARLPALRPKAPERFVQPRTLGPGFVRALFTDAHLQAAGLEPQAVWADVDARGARATQTQLAGRIHWAVLPFVRDGRRAATAFPTTARTLSCEAPVEGRPGRARGRLQSTA